MTIEPASRNARGDRDAARPRPDGAGDEHGQRLAEIRNLAHLLDEAFRIPVLGVRVGVDSLIGLVPGVGDLGGLALSSYLVVRAAQLGAPKRLLARMAMNVGVDSLVGAVPILGDLFDVVFKANRRNLRLLERHLERDLARRSSGS